MIIPRLAAILTLTIATAANAQRPTSATYITDEEVKAVLATPGIDHTIRVVDIGNENFAIGIIHRGPTATPAAAGAGGRAMPAASPCGDQMSSAPADAMIRAAPALTCGAMLLRFTITTWTSPRISAVIAGVAPL